MVAPVGLLLQLLPQQLFRVPLRDITPSRRERAHGALLVFLQERLQLGRIDEVYGMLVHFILPRERQRQWGENVVRCQLVGYVEILVLRIPPSPLS